MSQFDYIARAYGKLFRRGQKVIALGKPGTVTGADQHVHVRLDSLKHANPYHPDDVVPLPADFGIDPEDAEQLGLVSK